MKTEAKNVNPAGDNLEICACKKMLSKAVTFCKLFFFN